MNVRKYFTLPILLCTVGFYIGHAQGAHFTESALETEITAVTLFLEGAQIYSSGQTTLPTGNVALIAKGLSPHIDPASIQVRGSGAFTILSVNHRTDFLAERVVHARIDSLNEVIAVLNAEKRNIAARLSVLKELEDLLGANKNLNNQGTVDQIAEALILYEHHLGKIKSEEISLRAEHKMLDDRIAKVLKQVRTFSGEKSESKGEIEIRVSCEQPGPAEFEITYTVANAGWYPKYDIRVTDVESPLQLTYKAAVYQRTGVDWKNVRLRFSNANPKQGSTMPVLTPWRLNYTQHSAVPLSGTYTGKQISGRITDESGVPLIGANVKVVGTSVGTITDVNGYYHLALPQESKQIEISFVGYRSQILQISEPVINVQMNSDAILNEVQERRATATGVIRSRKGEESFTLVSFHPDRETSINKSQAARSHYYNTRKTSSHTYSQFARSPRNYMTHTCGRRQHRVSFCR
jgi:hypothetical protein